MTHRWLGNFRRRVFTSLTVLSLLLCIATLGLWVRSHVRLDGLYYYFDARRWALESVPGRIQFLLYRQGSPVPGEFDLMIEGFAYILGAGPPSPPTIWHVARINTWFRTATAREFVGFGFLTIDHSGGFSARGVAVPHWFLAVLFTVLPALRLRAALRRRRNRLEGRCPRCGYDLRATPDCCPECGTRAEAIANRG